MIEKFCGVCSESMSTLLEVYQMKKWGNDLGRIS
jgi:hypothetical protein